MPDIGAYHPQIVHFVVALLVVGVIFRLISLTGRLAFTGPAATTLILLGTIGTVLAVRSGTDAHGPAERIPGARALVVEHEEWGERTRNAFLAVGALELAALAMALRKHPRARTALAIAAVAGVTGLAVLYEAAEHGGQLVYSYAGGVGTRSGNPDDIGRLLVAGVYHQAALDREAGRTEETAALVESTARRFPGNIELQLMAVDWQIAVRKDPAGALERLSALALPEGDDRLKIRAGMLRATALDVAGDRTAARQVLETLKTAFPTNEQIQRRLRELGGT